VVLAASIAARLNVPMIARVMALASTAHAFVKASSVERIARWWFVQWIVRILGFAMTESAIAFRATRANTARTALVLTDALTTAIVRKTLPANVIPDGRVTTAR